MFFKTTLTVPKIKDLVNSPNQKYQNIYDTISHKSSSSGYTDIELLPNDNYNNESDSMKNELKSFLKKKLNGNSDNLMGLDSNTNFSHL